MVAPCPSTVVHRSRFQMNLLGRGSFDDCCAAPFREREMGTQEFNMRNFGIISQIAICSGGVIGGWLVAAGQLGITSFAQLRRHHPASAAPNFSTT